MSPEQEQALLDNVKSITDRLNMVDQVFAAARLGVDMVLVFECGDSGLFFPADYVRNWGRDWGDGLGPVVCSETLQTDYYTAPPEPDRNTRSLDQIMHPLYHSRAPIDAHLVERGMAEANMAIPMKDDENIVKRAPILYQKQLKNPLSKISRFQGMSLTQATWAIKKEGGFR